MAATKKANDAPDTPPPAPKPEPGQEAASQDEQDNTADMRTTRMPKGFVPQGAQSAPWWKLEEGNVLYGRIRGALFTMQDNRRTEYFQVQLHEPTLAEEGTKRAGNRRTVTVPKGALVSVSIKKKMEVLKAKVLLEQQAGASYDVWMMVGPKEELKNGNTFWNLQIATNCVKPPNARVGNQLIGGVSDSAPDEPSDDDIPF